MSLTAERLATADQVIRSTFEQTSIAWQTIPHWDTDDRGQAYVLPDLARREEQEDGNPTEQPVELSTRAARFAISHAQATADTPDALLASVIDHTVSFADDFDTYVLERLVSGGGAGDGISSALTVQGLLDALIGARCTVEDHGYRAPSWLIANTAYYKAIHQYVDQGFVGDGLLRAAGIGSVRRRARLEPPAQTKPPSQSPPEEPRALLLGRRQTTSDPSPGEEPVDLAVSVPPSLEVIGANRLGQVELAIRLRCAVRIKDAGGFVLLREAEKSAR